MRYNATTLPCKTIPCHALTLPDKTDLYYALTLPCSTSAVHSATLLFPGHTPQYENIPCLCFLCSTKQYYTLYSATHHIAIALCCIAIPLHNITPLSITLTVHSVAIPLLYNTSPKHGLPKLYHCFAKLCFSLLSRYYACPYIAAAKQGRALRCHTVALLCLTPLCPCFTSLCTTDTVLYKSLP